MKLISVILSIVLLLILIKLMNPSTNYSIKPLFVNKTEEPMIETIDVPETISINQEKQIIENRGPIVKTTNDFPIPQTTSNSKSLSTDYPENLSIITMGNAVETDPIIQEKRDGSIEEELYYPKYYLKDNLSGNTINTSEYRLAELNNNKSSTSWTDENVSQYPNYYSSQLKDEITNVGAFFDVNNNFVDTTKPRTDANVGDVCFDTEEGRICLENDKQHNIPPSLITNRNNCGFLNSIGLLEFSNNLHDNSDKVINGGFLYGTVKGSSSYKSPYSKPIEKQVLTCEL